MEHISSQKSAAQFLYPPVEPFERRMLPVGQGHTIYVEQSGKPDGEPVIVFHGGPGGGSSPAMRRYFDPKHYRIILFDQRGCGRSTPHASVDDNTTWKLLHDIELIRAEFDIDRWTVFGGSWGATLALVYAISYPDAVKRLILRGVFAMTQRELDWFYAGGAARFWPDAWARFASLVPEDEQGDMIGAYHKRLFSEDKDEQLRFARAWAGWENALASINSTGVSGEGPSEYVRAFSLIENHFFINGGFLDHDGWIFDNLHKISEIPGTIVQGRFDMICPPETAHRVAQGWGEKADLRLVPLAGHALSEAGITAELVRAMERAKLR